MALFNFGKKKEKPKTGAQIQREEWKAKEAAEFAARGWKPFAEWKIQPAYIGPHPKDSYGNAAPPRLFWEDFEVAMFCARENTNMIIDEAEVEEFVKECGIEHYKWRFLEQLTYNEMSSKRAEYVVFFHDVKKFELFNSRKISMKCFECGEFCTLYDHMFPNIGLVFCRFNDYLQMAQYQEAYALNGKTDRKTGVACDITMYDEEGEAYDFDYSDICNIPLTQNKEINANMTAEDWEMNEKKAKELRDLYVNPNTMEFCPEIWWKHRNKPFSKQIVGSSAWYRADLEEHEKACNIDWSLVKKDC